MFGESVFALIPDHEGRDKQMAQRLLGGDEMHRRMNTWWRRSMVCLSADQYAENLLESSGADVKRSRLKNTSRDILMLTGLVIQ